MGTMTETDYHKLSEAVADDLILNKIPLNDSIRKLAAHRELNQEQVSRLCEATNNATFNKLFKGYDKTAEDRIIDFDIANPKLVLSEAIKEAEYDSDAGSDIILLNEFRSLRPPENTYDKVAAAVEHEVEKPSLRRDQVQRMLQKTHAHLKTEKYAAELMYNDALVTVRNQFRRLYADIPFTEFEKQAAALHQQNSVRPLTDLRKMMRLPPVEYDWDKLTKTAGYVDDSPGIFQFFKNAVEYATKAEMIEQGLARLERHMP